ncbi:ammonia-forming cytochrome c nitrite reductase subunit c552 [Ferrimonas lipolytica]|uniref:nitrite reductase (cytochrome; ammonia-forming) n=1 Tax=Ferrimonas lipolytica TaxID=2724191 RepID=A0A6H1U9C9_9GAMM|nr:ammonia-forming cytochrome c nitrite reductase subunit c552 [Ferrimonas lipolytica]QIZ75655.1 ammonia-forming cytochrome c nitrite reductase subunit c552 [Ferrimonas lipolytica]
MKYLFSLALSFLLLGCNQSEAQKVDQPATLEPLASWESTSGNDERQDMLALRPQLIVLWSGSGYDKQFNTPRGHQFAMKDVTNVLRTGDGEYSASCWSCKGPAAPAMMEQFGENGFGAKTFAEVGHNMDVSVGCDDCHTEDQQGLQIARPFAQKAMAKIQQDFDKQNPAWQGAQTCGQCHVTYYFQPEQENRVNIPWIFGSDADAIEKYYDTRRFYDWIHPLSGAPMVKARHPEYEHWSRSIHAKQDVTCVSCHMPKKVDENGREFHSHNTGNVMDNFDSVCASCHVSKDELVGTLAKRKQQIDDARSEVEKLLVKAHAEAGALWRSGLSQTQLSPVLMDIRHSQWRWDFAVSSHGVHAHNPKEGLELLRVAKRQAQEARAKLQVMLSQNPEVNVEYPDISSKAAAHAATGMDIEALEKQKQQFLNEQVRGKWPGWKQVKAE